MSDLYNVIMIVKLYKLLTKFTNDKSLRPNGVPPNKFKTMNYVNLCFLLKFMTHYWKGRSESEGWHQFQVVPAP